MIKLPILESNNKPPSKLEQYLPTKIFISEPLALDGAALIPIDLGGRLIAPSVSINDLGKQLLKAAADGDVEEIRQLLSQGAPFTADWLGTSPLHLAAQGNHLEVCEILLRAGISKDARTKVDRTPLHMAAYEGHLDIVEILIRNGADLECTDLLCMTPLHWATQNGHANVVATLIRFGAAIESVNKFNLTPIDIAKQINRHDLAELLSMHTYDPNVATDNLVIELSAAEYSKDSNIDVQPTSEVASPTSSPLDVEEKSNGTVDDTEDTQDDSYSESAIKLLQEHGITMLPNDDSNILTSVMENGHSVVLTDVGKEVLNSVKSSEENDKSMQKQIINDKNFITVTPDEFLALTANASINSTNILRQVNGKLIPKTLKRIVMKRNKVIPVSTVPNIQQPKSSSKPVTDMETVMMQLIEARKTIEEYKEKLEMKEQEAERYKEQLKIFMNST